MSNDIRTRHVIVKLPAVTGEEADLAIEEIESYLGDTMVTGATVSHALGEAVLAGSLGVDLEAKARPGVLDGLVFLKTEVLMTHKEAREVAGALLILADEAEGGTR
jgi:hypothetical protein